MAFWDIGASSLLSSGASLLQNFLNRDSQQEFNQQQLALAREQMGMQREFAQHGIQWKVQDAVAAGLHPLAALGANTASPSPVSVGGEAPKYDFSQIGQDLSRAAKANAELDQRVALDRAKAADYAAEGLRLDNIMKSDAISTRRAAQLGPPVPMPRPGPNRTVDGLAVSEDDLKQKQGDIPEQAFSRPFGYKVYHNPYFSDGQVSENRYGDSELLSTAKAGVNLLADHAYTGYLGFPREGWGIRGGGSRAKFRSRAREF